MTQCRHQMTEMSQLSHAGVGVSADVASSEFALDPTTPVTHTSCTNLHIQQSTEFE